MSETSSFAPPPDAPQPPVEDAGSGPADDHLGGVSLPLRIYTSPLAHRVIPAGLAMRLLAGLGPAVRQRRNPAERADGLFAAPLVDNGQLVVPAWDHKLYASGP